MTGLDIGIHFSGKICISLNDIVCLFQIINRQCHGVIGLADIPVIVFLCDRAGDRNRFGRFIQRLQEGIVPAAGRFQFFRRDHIICITAPEFGVLDRSHQAGVKADPVQMGVPAIGERRRVHGGADLSELQAVIAEKFIYTKAVDGSVAMIPEDQAVMLCRVIGCSDLQELCQGLRGTHVGVSVCSTYDPVIFSPGQIQHAVAVTGDIAEPFACAACIDDHVVLLKINAG